MSKPAAFAWAVDATYTRPDIAGDANKVTPSSGRIAQGWEPDDKPSAENLNERLNLIGQWLAWLAPLFTDGGGYVAPANENVAVSGTGRFTHGDRTLHIGAAAFVCDSGFGTLSQLGYVSASGGVAKAYATIQLPAGKRIRSVTVYYDRDGAGAVQPVLQRMAPSTGTITTIWTGANDAAGSGITSQSDAATDHEILATDVYWIAVSLTSSSNKLYGAMVVYDEQVLP